MMRIGQVLVIWQARKKEGGAKQRLLTGLVRSSPIRLFTPATPTQKTIFLE